MVHMLVICCKYLQNARYAQVQDWHISFSLCTVTHAVPSGRALSCWDRGFESHRGMDICCECFVLSGRGLCD